MISRFLTGVAIAALLSTPAVIADAASRSLGATSITFRADKAYPESMSWSARHARFFIGSVRFGTIGTVDISGKYAPFVTDKVLVSSVGIFVDDRNNRVLVANSDPGAGTNTNAATVGKLAGIAVYDMSSSRRLAYYDLGKLSEGSHFANDIALDGDGNIYVTDSFAPVIYKIDADGHSSIFLKDASFHSAEGFNLNGIAYHPDGYLLVGKYNSGQLFRIDLRDRKIETVALPSAIVGADGFSLAAPDRLIIAVNAGADKTIELVSSDEWRSATFGRELGSLASMPTAVTRAGEDLWVLNSRLDTLFDPQAEKVSDYLLQKF